MAADKVQSSYFNPVVFLAGVIGLIQAVTWFVLSLFGVLAHRCVLNTPNYSEDNQFAPTLVKLYFQGHECEVTGLTLTDSAGKPFDLELNVYPTYLHGWMAAYLSMNILYFFTSFFILWYKNTPGSTLTNWVRGWSALTLGFLVMDLTLTIQFGQDFGSISDQLTKYKVSKEFGWMTSIPGAMFAIAARGFALWILNLVLFIYFAAHVVNWMSLCPTIDVKLDTNDPRVIDAIEEYNRNKEENTWKHNERALVPANYDFNKVYLPRAWDVTRNPNTVEVSTRFGGEDEYDMRPISRPQRPVIWDEDDVVTVGNSAYKARASAEPNSYFKSSTERRQRDNLAFVDDDNQRRSSVPGRRTTTDFSHNIRNFEPGRGYPKTGNGNKPYGAPVRVPPAPALPKADSHYY